MNNFISEALGLVSELFFPDNIYCMGCGDALDSDNVYMLCSSCMEKIPWNLKNPYRHNMDEYSFDAVYPCMRYGFYGRRIMNDLKTGGKAYYAKPLGRILADRARLENLSADYIVPVPSHPRKVEIRGYNQAVLLAENAASVLGIPVLPECLLKLENTASMRVADAVTRSGLLKGSFALNPKYEALIRGKNIILVDDVITTGSTADECSLVLKAGGALSVAVLCIGASHGPHAEDEELEPGF